METPLITGAFALLLLTIALLQPLARRLGLAPSVLLAMVGTMIGIGATYLLYTPATNAFNTIANVFVYPPLNSEMILYIFLPLLLFQTSLTLDVRRIFEDLGPILLMAVVAVFAATAFIGFALYPLSGMPLVVCLLLGAIVATTDPVAVVAIFRDIGAPARLGRIVEGESLLNDAAAIVLFVILLGIATGQQSLDAGEAAMAFGRSFIGGVIVGTVLARIAVSILPLMRDLPLAQVTLSLALPYGIYVVSDQFADVSAVVAVVCAGIVFNFYGPSRIQPKGWEFLHTVWDQLSFLAASLIFLLSAILIPRLVEGFAPIDIVLLFVVIVAALASRALVIYGLLPVLSRVRLGQAVSTNFKTVMLWGGMRGAVTLTLALSVSEHALLSDDVSAFITKLATGFVLFTLLVYGTSLKPLIKLLGLDKLNPLDEALRSQYQALALSDVRQEVGDAASAYHIAPRVTSAVLKDYEERASVAASETNMLEKLTDKDRVRIGLIALADREQQLVLEHFHDKTISGPAVSKFLTITGRMGDLTRSDGRSGYNKATRRPLRFGQAFRVAQALQRRLRISRPLAIRLADRFEFLLVYRILADELIDFNSHRIRPLLGDRIGDILHETLASRQADTMQAIDALRLQYPDYADALENQFLRKAGVRLEENAYDVAKSQMLIGTELHQDLLREVETTRRVCHQRPKLDLGMKTKELVTAHPLFAGLPKKQQKAIMKVMRPQFAVPGEKLIRKGDRGDAAYFIASGAVEVRTATHNVLLGRGDVFGEIALMTGGRRSADVFALGYCQLVRLRAQDFKKLLADSTDLQDHVAMLAQKRQLMNSDDEMAEIEDPVVPLFANDPVDSVESTHDTSEAGKNESADAPNRKDSAEAAAEPDEPVTPEEVPDRKEAVPAASQDQVADAEKSTLTAPVEEASHQPSTEEAVPSVQPEDHPDKAAETVTGTPAAEPDDTQAYKPAAREETSKPKPGDGKTQKKETASA
ncbi:cyclic nucleotide-binding domain-containing protein [Roseibium denhamense]|uniref:Sodium/proton antiporter, CPA1 family n=1 Tax=Roseibium denhamense TaxID=76305 RepID=A0ABY1P4Q8_9HYPH|nr:cation:proton antiporter [Roseibium denhamense]MTI05165.1 cyclic nucleotide-binding domain-containing protein [Roseibium denhamense]SMP25890.1 sodium/proton antiporter, CPA1 family [Roseibium denhamense]